MNLDDDSIVESNGAHIVNLKQIVLPVSQIHPAPINAVATLTIFLTLILNRHPNPKHHIHMQAVAVISVYVEGGE